MQGRQNQERKVRTMSGGHGGGHGKGGLYHTLEQKFDYTKNPFYKKLHSSHSKAHNITIKEMGLGDTTGLDENKILEHMANYMMRFDQKNGKAPEKVSDLQKKIYQGKAQEFLEEVAKGREMDMGTLMTQLYRDGIESAFETYRDNERRTEVSRLHRVNLREVTSSLDYDMRLGLAKELQEKIPELKDNKAEEIVPGLDNLLLQHFGNYHERTVKKEKKEKKRAMAGAAR